MMNSQPPDNLRPKRPLSSSFWVFILILFISLLTVFFLRHKPVWYEVEILAGELIVILGLFYPYVLYTGINFEHEPFFFTRENLTYDKVSDWFTEGGGINFTAFTSMGGELVPIIGHIIGFIIDLVVAFIFTLVLSFLVWLGLNFLMTGLIFIASYLYYFFRRSTSIVIRHQAICRGRIVFASLYGLLYACLYSLIICLMVFLLRLITP